MHSRSQAKTTKPWNYYWRRLSKGDQKERIALTVAMKIALHNAKTVKPGELQWLHIEKIPSLLCPWSAMRRLIKESTLPTIHLPLFSYYKKGKLITLSKSAAINIYKKVWTRYDPDHRLSTLPKEVYWRWYNQCEIDLGKHAPRWRSWGWMGGNGRSCCPWMTDC